MTFPLHELIELGVIQTGSTPLTSDSNYWDGDVPFVTPSELDKNSPVVEAPRTLSEAGVLQSRLLQAGSVMVCCIGSLGKIGIAGRTVVTNQQINSIEFDPRKIWPKYGFYACQRLKPTLMSIAPATTIPIVSKSKFGQLQIPVPPLPEQRRIAAILDQVDALRTKRREVLAQLDNLTQSIFIEMFGDPSVNPKGWPINRLADLVVNGDAINYGVIQPGDDVDEGIPLVRVSDLIGGRVNHDALKIITPEIEGAYKRSRLHGDEVLVSCVGTIGVVVLASELEKGFNIARAIARIRLSADNCREFIAAQLQTEGIQRYFTSELRTVSQPTLNIKQICETRVMQPPLEIQLDFYTRIKSVEALKASHIDAMRKLDMLFLSLQHSAFRGEL